MKPHTNDGIPTPLAIVLIAAGIIITGFIQTLNF